MKRSLQQLPSCPPQQQEDGYDCDERKKARAVGFPRRLLPIMALTMLPACLWLLRMTLKQNDVATSYPALILPADGNGEAGVDGGSFPPEVRRFPPAACHGHVVREFPTLTSLLERGKGAQTG